MHVDKRTDMRHARWRAHCRVFDFGGNHFLVMMPCDVGTSRRSLRSSMRSRLGSMAMNRFETAAHQPYGGIADGCRRILVMAPISRMVASPTGAGAPVLKVNASTRAFPTVRPARTQSTHVSAHLSRHNDARAMTELGETSTRPKAQQQVRGYGPSACVSACPLRGGCSKPTEPERELSNDTLGT